MRYRIRILAQAGTQCWIEEVITSKLVSASGNTFQFVDAEGKWKYYPINNTIVEQIDDLTPEL